MTKKTEGNKNKGLPAHLPVTSSERSLFPPDPELDAWLKKAIKQAP